MCGIAAVLNRRGTAHPLNLDCLKHRGPDASGHVSLSEGKLWLGHTRLAILDLSLQGNQPMTDHVTGNVIIFNGEIYNHREIRKELPSRSWQSNSDTETILAAYAAWGTDMLGRLRGMFAFIIYDAKRSSLIAARDPLGIKPLYYEDDGDSIRFSSEVRPLLAKREHPLNPNALAAYLRLGAFPESALPLQNLRVLPAGSYLCLNTSKMEEPRTYWPDSRPGLDTQEPSLAMLRTMVESAVEEHLLSDVPVGAFLSGGVDSSLTTTLAARRLGRELETFTVSLPGFAGDERAIAEQTARKLGCRHHTITVDETRAIEGVTQAVSCMDLPSVDAVNTYLVASEVSRLGIKVALSGLGGDELFGGYPSFRDVPRLRSLAKVPRFLFQVLSPMNPHFRRLADLPSSASIAQLAAWRRFFATSRELQPLFGNHDFPLFPMPPSALDDYGQISWAELTGYTRHLLLRDTDQMTMAVSLEARVPLLDTRLVEYALALPGSWKQEFPYTKGALVAAFQDTLPVSCYDRPKQGFELPMASWIRGPLKAYVKEGLNHLRERAAFLEPLIRNRVNCFQQDRTHWTRLWLLVVLGHYMQANAFHADTPGSQSGSTVLP